MKRVFWLGIALALPAAYLALCGLGWAWVSDFGFHRVAFDAWHPFVAAFLVTGTGAALAFMEAAWGPGELPECRECEKIQRRLGAVTKDRDEIRQALLVLEPPAASGPRGDK